MLAVNDSMFPEHGNAYCDKVTQEDETVLVTRKGEKNVVLISLEEWNRLQKAARNAEYLTQLDRSFQQLEQGRGVAHGLL